MATYNIIWKASARKELKKLDKSAIPKIVSSIEELANNPFPANSKRD